LAVVWIGAIMGRIKKRGILFLAGLWMGLFLCGCEKSAGSSYREGIRAFASKDYDAAESCFADAIGKNSDKAEYYISYAFTLMQNEKNDEALAQFQKAVLDKDNQIVKENNKAAYRGMGILYYKEQEYDKAIELFERALKIREAEDLDSDIYGYLASCMELKGDEAEAISYYNKLLKKEKSAVLYAKRALAQQRAGEAELAKKDYDSAISIESRDYNLYIQKYWLLMQNGEEAAAKEVLQQAASIEPKTAGEKYGQSKVFYFLGQSSAAETGFLEALENGFIEAGFYLGLLAQENGRMEEAMERYIAYIESGKKISSAAVYNQLGICYLKLGNYVYARDTFSMGLKCNDIQLVQELQFNKIIAYEYLGQYKKALVKADEYLENYPNDKKMKRERKFIKTRVRKK